MVRLEPFYLFVSEPHRPHDGVGTAEWLNGCTQGHEVGVTAYFDRLVRAGLHAAVTFPAHIDGTVEGLVGGLIEHHQVVRTDILAGGLVERFTSVAFFIDYKA